MHETKRTYKVGISGSYGGLNLGDEAILQCIIRELRRSLPVEITVFSRNAAVTRQFHRVENAVPTRDFSRNEVLPEIEKLDLFILGGGGILFDGDVKDYLREVALALEHNVPVMTYAIGAGPLKDPVNQTMVRDNLNRAAVVTVRERSAQRVLEEAGVMKDIVITADPALLLTPDPLPDDLLCREGVDPGRRLIGVSVREPGMAAPDLDVNAYHALLANAADYMTERYNADIVFVPMERKTYDLQHSHAVIAQMLRPERAIVLKGDYSPGQILSLMKHFIFAVGMRLHFLMFAALQEIPFVALPYAAKVTGFLEDLQVDAPPIQLVNPGRLIAHIDNSWDDRGRLIRRIKEIMPALQQRAQHTNEIAVQLLRKQLRRRPKEKIHAAP